MNAVNPSGEKIAALVNQLKGVFPDVGVVMDPEGPTSISPREFVVRSGGKSVRSVYLPGVSGFAFPGFPGGAWSPFLAFNFIKAELSSAR